MWIITLHCQTTDGFCAEYVALLVNFYYISIYIHMTKLSDQQGVLIEK